MNKYPIMTIISDFALKNEIINIAHHFELSGYIVLLPLTFESESYPTLEPSRFQNERRDMIYSIMKQKIDMGDEIYVINDHANDCTKSLIEYAKSKNKPIRYKWVELS